MSAEVEVIIERHENVLTIPVTAVVETAQGAFCWVMTTEGAKRRSLKLGDADDNFAAVQTGLQQGDEVVLDPLASITEAQTLAFKLIDAATPHASAAQETDYVD